MAIAESEPPDNKLDIINTLKITYYLHSALSTSSDVTGPWCGDATSLSADKLTECIRLCV